MQRENINPQKRIKTPNKALEPTTMLVTICAFLRFAQAQIAPSMVAAHL